LIKLTNQKISLQKQKDYVDYLITKRQSIIDLAKHDRDILLDDFDWIHSEIDSIKYDYVFPKPGADSIIKWPASTKIKNSQLDNKLVFARIQVNSNDGKNKIIMSIDAVPYINGKWVIMEEKPTIERQN
jgi:hypothetical protein